MRLQDASYDSIMHAPMSVLYDLSLDAGIQDDENLDHSEDLRERLILMKRKMDGSSHTWKHLFQSVKEETQIKSESLIELMKTVEATFQTFPMDSLSEVLRKEGHLKSRDLLDEISSRMKSLIEHRSLVIVAGETNGGKSTFLNLLLGEDILPTDVLHCTFSICKIVYSDSYSITTVDHNNVVEHFPCACRDQVKALLKAKVAQQEMRERVLGSPIKEITLGLPADILKSGVILVDTPGIGEDEKMDNVTMNYVKSTNASAFIYIIKSDTAGGVQGDRLLGFLKAIKERYSAGSEVEAYDHRAAMFVCHRWDNINQHQKDKVKKNALDKLEYVWPEFEASQTYFFSTKKTMKHLPVDPLFVSDSFMTLLKGLKLLFERASHNAIKHQYLWLKYMLQPASRHLKSMITHCNHSNDDLDTSFRSVEINQNRLMQSSKENSRRLQQELDFLSMDLKGKIISFLNFGNISLRNEIHDSEEIFEVCSKEDFFNSRANRRLLDEMIIRCLLKHVDEYLLDRRLLFDMESRILTAIQEHLGLFRIQINHIKYAMQNGGVMSLTRSSSSASLDKDDLSMRLGSSTLSTISTESGTSMESLRDEMNFDTTQLASKVKSILLTRKNGKSRSANNSKHGFHESLISKMKSRFKYGLMPHSEPTKYVEERMHKIAKDIRDDNEIMDSVVLGYTEWIQQCVNYATKSIPKFIEVNNQLMDEIREHRSNFQRNRNVLWKIMEDLEPCRHYLRGYGLLYMDDINADMLAFNIEQRNSTVFFPKDLTAEHRMNDDSGFRGSGSTKRKVQSLWAKMQGALIRINNKPEEVVAKTYIYDMDDKELFSEIASLRCLDCANLAPFLGMTRIVATENTRGDVCGVENVTEKVSAFIFKGGLVSARVYSGTKMTSKQLFIPVFVNCLLQGLNYIHREGLVHMELNLDTVMVDRLTGVVQLCQMCKPREARFPADQSIITQTCICLSPSVLHGHVYESTDDLYAFGLLLWEILKPDEPPYKAQRTWQLRKFISEIHPIDMLQDALKQLNLSENIQDVLKGTLLLSRKSVCMPIATIQSLLMEISDDEVIKQMPSRPRPKRTYVRTDSSSSLVSERSGSTERIPQRPPRRTDKIKVTVSEESPEMSIRKNVLPQNRRQSLPAILIHPAAKTKKNFIQKIFGKRSPKVLLDNEIQIANTMSNLHMNSPATLPSEFYDKSDGKKTASEHKEVPSPMLKPKVPPKYAKKETVNNSKPQNRRLSLQEPPFYGSNRSSIQQNEKDDIPSLLSELFPMDLNSSSIKKDSPKLIPVTYLQSHNVFSASLPSLPFSHEPARSAETAADYSSHTQQSNTDKIPPSRSSGGKQQNTFLNLDSTLSRPHSPLVVPQRSPRFLGRPTRRSSHEEPGISGRHLKHTGLSSEIKMRSPLGRYFHDMYIGQRLGNSLQDVSASTRSIEPIIEEKSDTSISLLDITRHSVTDPNDERSSFQKKYGYFRYSSPGEYQQTEKSSFPSLDATVEDDNNLSSLASSLSSLGQFSEFSTDPSGYEQENTLDDSKPEFTSDTDVTFKHRRSNAYEKSKYKGNVYFQHTKSHKLPAGNSTDIQPDLLTSRESGYLDSSYSDSPDVFSSGSLQGTFNFSFGDTDPVSETVSEIYPSGASASASPPPPPAIDFSKLTFGMTDHCDDDDFSD